jgi:hypothetical protein
LRSGLGQKWYLQDQLDLTALKWLCKLGIKAGSQFQLKITSSKLTNSHKNYSGKEPVQSTPKFRGVHVWPYRTHRLPYG